MTTIAADSSHAAARGDEFRRVAGHALSFGGVRAASNSRPLAAGSARPKSRMTARVSEGSSSQRQAMYGQPLRYWARRIQIQTGKTLPSCRARILEARNALALARLSCAARAARDARGAAGPRSSTTTAPRQRERARHHRPRSFIARCIDCGRSALTTGAAPWPPRPSVTARAGCTTGWSPM